MTLFDDDTDEEGEGNRDPARMEDGQTGQTPPAPRANHELVSHGTLERTLLAWWREGAMPHTLVLAGPAGVGKATLAFRLARFLLANPQPGQGGALFAPEAEQDSLAIGRGHPTFAKVASGGHPDLLSVARTINEKTGHRHDAILVDDVREVPGFLRKTASEGGWRIVVIDEAETLNRNAQNALLKILEEPPSQSLLMLVTQTAGALIPTIRSRARIMQVPAPDRESFTGLMRRYHPELSAPDTGLLARLSGNAPGRAMALLDQGGMEAIRGVFAMLETLQGAPDSDLWTMAEKMAVKSTPDPLAGMLDLVGWVLQEDARAAALAGANGRLRDILETIDELTRHRAACETGNLDRRHTAFGALRIVQTGLRAAA